MSTKLILAIFLVFLLSYALFVSFKPKESYEDMPLKIVLVHATWCSHCVAYVKSGTFLRTFNEQVKGKRNVEFEMLDYDKNKDVAEKYDINSFPTIIAVDGKGELLGKFEGDRNKPSDLVAFVDKFSKQ